MALRELFGGAIKAKISDGFLDASQLREIPDTQEVFVHSQTDASVIIEILEVADVAGAECGSWHFWNIAEENDAKEQSQILNVENYSGSAFPKLPSNAIVSLVHGRSLISKYRENARNLVNVHLAVVRLPAPHSSDIVITYNDPALISTESSSAGAVANASGGGAVVANGVVVPNGGGGLSTGHGEFTDLVNSFSIVDFSLFG
ncbi:hypothetical protein HDU93_003111 [Gonapodya sp. JEL0774]|nr:hypothetical protein HDU93_003111 [Gonapodya sp. JEL0774]